MNKFSILWIVLITMSCSIDKKKQGMDQARDSTGVKETNPTLNVYTLANKNGLTMRVTNWGGRIMSLMVPDKKGILGDIVLGYDSSEQYLNGNPYFGALIGRVGNRIAKGKFSLEGKGHNLAINNGVNALHGGPHGFHNVYWEAIPSASTNALELHYLSKDGEEGYPGNLDVKVTYTLTDKNELMIDYAATTDKTTIVNLTHHSFFNLAGDGGGDILKHEIMIPSDRFTPVDQGLIPTGELRKVEGTPFDFRKPHAIGERIGNDDDQLRFGKGYDHNWVLNKKGNDLSLAARVTEPVSGRVMEVWTTEPGLQFYSGNFLNGKDIGKGGKPYPFRGAFCLEAQHFPDSPNHPEFPSIVLRPGSAYQQKTVYKFLIAK
ncbi:MAG TPA: aldose epimerase family protein [Cyclobacteriaceae bacterium]|nr:aldose epimerase family protein [Cyclobacteriaceae bacterium]